MRWQREIHEILEKANWPPSAPTLIRSPWPKIIGVALLGWVVFELVARAGENARSQRDRSRAY